LSFVLFSKAVRATMLSESSSLSSMWVSEMVYARSKASFLALSVSDDFVTSLIEVNEYDS
jgi:hypothetical protein